MYKQNIINKEQYKNYVVIKAANEEDKKGFLVDNNPELLKYLTQNNFKWVISKKNNKDYGLLSASNADCKRIYGKTTIRLHQLIMQFYFGETEIFKKYKENGTYIIDHLNNKELDNRISNLHFITQKQNKSKQVIDENIDYNRFYIKYKKDGNGKLDYDSKLYLLQYITENPLKFFEFHNTTNDTTSKTNMLTMAFRDYDKYYNAVCKISLLTTEYLKIKKIMEKSKNEEENRNNLISYLQEQPKSYSDIEKEIRKNIINLVNRIYKNNKEDIRVKLYYIYPLFNTTDIPIKNSIIYIKNIENNIIKRIEEKQINTLKNEEINKFINKFCMIDYLF